MARPFDRDVVESKLAHIAGYVEDLRRLKDLSLEDYQSDVLRKRGIEKTLINLVQAATDINNYLLARVAEAASADNFGSFVELGEQDILPRDFAEKIAPAAGLRSRLVHEYQRIDDAVVRDCIPLAIEQFTAYSMHIRRYLD